MSARTADLLSSTSGAHGPFFDVHRLSVYSLCMAVKTISLEVDAYERLKAARLAHESFSQAVRRLIPPPPGRAAQLLARARASGWGEQLDWNRVEQAYRSRRRRPRA